MPWGAAEAVPFFHEDTSSHCERNVIKSHCTLDRPPIRELSCELIIQQYCKSREPANMCALARLVSAFATAAHCFRHVPVRMHRICWCSDEPFSSSPDSADGASLCWPPDQQNYIKKPVLLLMWSLLIDSVLDFNSFRGMSSTKAGKEEKKKHLAFMEERYRIPDTTFSKVPDSRTPPHEVKRQLSKVHHTISWFLDHISGLLTVPSFPRR